MTDFIKFLGTAGARFVMLNQLRASGGIWLSLAGRNILLDPGPGALVRCLKSRPKLDPEGLDTVILSHKHLDHSNDVNVIIEALTAGGFKRRGVLFAPQDALEGDDPIVLRYLRDHLDGIVVLAEKGEYRLGELRFRTPVRHLHEVETYGFNFTLPDGLRVAFITDTLFFPELITAYSPADVLILNVTRLKADRPEIQHLNVSDARKLITKIGPKLAVLTHFGMGMLRAKPWEVAAQLERETGVKTIAASDGLRLELNRAQLGV